MYSVRNLLQTKGTQVWTIAPDASVYEAIELMAAKNIGAVLIIDQDRLAGILTERDYARKIILQGKSSRSTPVREIMTSRVVYVTPDRSIEECMALMTDKKFRHLPVLEDGELIGIISIGDVIKAIIANQQFMIEQLESYITSG